MKQKMETIQLSFKKWFGQSDKENCERSTRKPPSFIKTENHLLGFDLNEFNGIRKKPTHRRRKEISNHVKNGRNYKSCRTLYSVFLSVFRLRISSFAIFLGRKQEQNMRMRCNKNKPILHGTNNKTHTATPKSERNMQ